MYIDIGKYWCYNMLQYKNIHAKHGRIRFSVKGGGEARRRGSGREADISSCDLAILGLKIVHFHVNSPSPVGAIATM